MPQLSCPTAWCSSRGEHVVTATLLSRARNSMIRELLCRRHQLQVHLPPQPQPPQRRDLLCKNSFSCHASVPLRIIEPVSPEMSDSSQHLLFALWKMFLEPVFEQRRDRPGQTHNCVTGELRARFCAGVQDLWDLMI